MKLYRLQRKQRLPMSLDEAWAFFSAPQNLSEITPPWLKFQIKTDTSRGMYPGQIIRYRITLPPGIPTTWITEITHVREPTMFVDEQRFGPYRLWHHQHHFKELEDGVEMEDMVHYVLPFWWLGRLAHAAMVKRQLNQIFDYRYAFLEQKFGKAPQAKE